MARNITYIAHKVELKILSLSLNYYFSLYDYFSLILLFFFFSFLGLNLLFGTQRRPRRPKLFYKQEAGDTAGSCSVTIPLDSYVHSFSTYRESRPVMGPVAQQ